MISAAYGEREASGAHRALDAGGEGFGQVLAEQLLHQVE
jgi:hypothetical protein